MNLKLFVIVLSFSFVCQGQKQKTDTYWDVNFKNVKEIKGLIYFKVDTTLVTGKVIRYNKKNEAKRYIFVTKGKPDILGWIQIRNNYVRPEESLLGEVITVAGIGAGAVMPFTGNDLNIPFQGRTNVTTGNEFKSFQNSQKDYTKKMYDEILERNDISHDLELNKSSENRKIQDKSKLLNTKANKKDGPWELYYPNNSLESRGNYKDNKREGVWEEYYENGKLKSKSYYVHGKKENLLELYHSNGNLKGKLYYENGKEDGNVEMYHMNGILYLKGKFKEGKQAGDWKYFNVKGELINTENFEN